MGSIRKKSGIVLVWDGPPPVGNDSYDHCFRFSGFSGASYYTPLEDDIVIVYQVNRKHGCRRIIAVITVIAGLFFVVLPFVLKPEVQELERKGRHYRESSDINSK